MITQRIFNETMSWLALMKGRPMGIPIDIMRAKGLAAVRDRPKITQLRANIDQMRKAIDRSKGPQSMAQRRAAVARMADKLASH